MFRCEEFGCEASYKCQKSLKKHVDSVHYGVGAVLYACHRCPSQYKSGAYLSKHLINTHQYERPPGYNRFTYRVDQDGIFRLSTVVNGKLRAITDGNNDDDGGGESQEYDSSALRTGTVKMEPIEVEKTEPMTHIGFDIGKVESLDRSSISIELKVREVLPREPSQSPMKTNGDNEQAALPVLMKTEPCSSSSTETIHVSKNVDDFTVMKRYIKEEKTVVISFEETDSAGSVIRSETVQTTELTPDGLLSNEL